MSSHVLNAILWVIYAVVIMGVSLLTRRSERDITAVRSWVQLAVVCATLWLVTA